MDKQNEKFDIFIETVTDNDKDFVVEVNDYLIQNNCECEIKTAKSGFTVSYKLNTTKQVLATFVSRKTGMKLRIYPKHINEYQSFLNTLPEKIKKDIKKSSICKRLVNPDDCNPKCVMGYEFFMDNEHYQKCRYMAFMPALSNENNSYIKKFLQHELNFQ